MVGIFCGCYCCCCLSSNSGHIDAHVVRMRMHDYRNQIRNHCSVLVHDAKHVCSVVRHELNEMEEKQKIVKKNM